MHSPSWEETYNQLAAAGLIVQSSALEKLGSLKSVMPLIEAANSSGVRLLDASTVDELLAISPTEPVASIEPANKQSQATLPRSEQSSPHGRVLAPISTPESLPPRPRLSSGFNTSDFPMDASDVESDVEIHFDITGNSSTEGKLSDIQSFFRSRLEQIRGMMISHGVLPRRPISNSEAWRNRKRLNTKELEFTIVGLASDVRWTQNGWMRFVLEDESTQITCMLKPPSEASPLHPSLDGLMNDEIIGVSGLSLLARENRLCGPMTSTNHR